MNIHYQERLEVPLRWWVQAGMLIASFWLACAVAMPVAAASVIAVLLILVALGLFWKIGRSKIQLNDEFLRAGNAKIELSFLESATSMDTVATRELIGPKANAAAFHLIRPYLKKSVLINFDDPKDPTPYWLLQTRKPELLADKINHCIEEKPWKKIKK